MNVHTKIEVVNTLICFKVSSNVKCGQDLNMLAANISYLSLDLYRLWVGK
jgi:hypothetical protein